MAPDAIALSFQVGMRFVVADARIFVNVDAQPLPFAPGSYTWQVQSGSFSVSTYDTYTTTIPARVLLCVAEGPTPTLTSSPTGTAGPGDYPDAISNAICVVAALAPTANLGPLPDLAIAVPTLRTLPTLTATVQISVTVVVGAVGTMQAGLQTPVAAVRTVTAGYSWQSGADTAEGWTLRIQPALDWLAILNPNNPAYTTSGGPLWALAPVLVPLLPIVVITILVAFGRFVIWLIGWLLKLLDLLFKLIELIPGE